MATRHGIKTAVLVLVSVAAIGAGSAAALAASRPSTPARPAAGRPVVLNCLDHAQIRPGQYTLACADGNSYLRHLHWAAWGSSAAFGNGTYSFNDCVPSCVAGHGHSLAVLVALWRAEARPGHPGQRYFTRLTVIYTGAHSYRAGGKVYHLPGAQTFPLNTGGGA